MLRVFLILSWTIASAISAAAQADSRWTSEPMLEAGAEALSGELGERAATSGNLRRLAEAAFAAMSPYQWRPIETAPLDRKILLGRPDGPGFEVALGQWEVTDDWPYDGGRWSVTYLWQAEPTHWLDVPPPPE
jgi:hypothetical protein